MSEHDNFTSEMLTADSSLFIKIKLSESLKKYVGTF